MSRPGRRLATAGVAIGLVVSGACRSPSPSGADLACERATSAELAALQRDVGTGRLSQGFELTVGPHTFVSAERTKPGKDGDHDILTWVRTGQTPPAFEAVDSFARTETTWPPSALRVSTRGAMDSRVCTYEAYNRAKRIRNAG